MLLRCALYMYGAARRKQQRPGIAKNDKNNGTIKTTKKPTKPHPNSQRTTLQTCAPNIRRSTHISQHSTPINTQVTAHRRSIPQATHAHPRPRRTCMYLYVCTCKRCSTHAISLRVGLYVIIGNECLLVCSVLHACCVTCLLV